jgi:small subunit ribosomal protein S6
MREPVRGRSRNRRCGVATQPYELMYLVQPGADEERLGAISERIQTTITSLGGAVEKAVPMGRRRLAYEVGRHREGLYQVVEFRLPTDQARELDRTIKLTEDILRHLVVKRDAK